LVSKASNGASPARPDICRRAGLEVHLVQRQMPNAFACSIFLRVFRNGPRATCVADAVPEKQRM